MDSGGFRNHTHFSSQDWQVDQWLSIHLLRKCSVKHSGENASWKRVWIKHFFPHLETYNLAKVIRYHKDKNYKRKMPLWEQEKLWDKLEQLRSQEFSIGEMTASDICKNLHDFCQKFYVHVIVGLGNIFYSYWHFWWHVLR